MRRKHRARPPSPWSSGSKEPAAHHHLIHRPWQLAATSPPADQPVSSEILRIRRISARRRPQATLPRGGLLKRARQESFQQTISDIIVFPFFGNSSQVRALLVPCMRACVAELLKACPHVPPTPRESARAQMVPPFPFIFSLNPIIIYNYIHKIACIKLYKAKTLYAKIKTDLYYKEVKYLYNKLMQLKI